MLTPQMRLLPFLNAFNSPGGDGGGFHVAGAERAQAGSRRLHDQAVTRGFGESVAFEASSFKGNQTTQSRRSGVQRLAHWRDAVSAYWIFCAGFG
jgi:hypothetical protein